jgi:amidohydrolase
MTRSCLLCNMKVVLTIRQQYQRTRKNTGNRRLNTANKGSYLWGNDFYNSRKANTILRSSVNTTTGLLLVSFFFSYNKHPAVYALPFRLVRGVKDSVANATNTSTAVDAIILSTTGIDGPAIGDVLMQNHPFTKMKQTASSSRNLVAENYTQLHLTKRESISTTHSTNLTVRIDSLSNDEDLSKAASIELRDEIRHKADQMKSFLIDVRRTLHRHPELMYQEEFTSAIIGRLLQQMNISYTTGWGKNIHAQHFNGAAGGHGIVADIGTGKEPCILLRADMDALPIQERTKGIDNFRSLYDNKMHACGHDGHTTMLLGAASILKSMEDSIPGTVRIIFQPAEEGGAGGKRMTEEGVLEKVPKPIHAFGMHVWPTLPSGTIAARAGSLMAACERFEILIHGVGGHAAMPSLTIDPIVAASAIVMNLQTIVSRNTSPLEAAVCSITQFDAGSGAFNVIPEAATLKGTIRSLSTATLLQLRDRVQHIVQTTAKTYGCNVTIEYSPDYYPVTVNDPWLYENMTKHIASLISDEGYVRDTEPTMGAEDFSFIAELIPSTFFFLGQGSGTEPLTNYGLHHPHFALDESILTKGVELHVNLAIRSLTQLSRDVSDHVP